MTEAERSMGMETCIYLQRCPLSACLSVVDTSVLTAVVTLKWRKEILMNNLSEVEVSLPVSSQPADHRLSPSLWTLLFFYVKCLCVCHYLWPTNYKAVVWRFTAAASRGGTLTHSPSLTVQCNGGNYTQTCTHRPWDNHTLKQILTPGH